MYMNIPITINSSFTIVKGSVFEIQIQLNSNTLPCTWVYQGSIEIFIYIELRFGIWHFDYLDFFSMIVDFRAI